MISCYGQTYSGTQVVGSCNFEYQIEIKSDSSFICTKNIFNPIKEQKKKKRKQIEQVNDCRLVQSDTFAYYTGKAKKINDSTTFMSLNNSYALSFYVDDYFSSKFNESKQDSMLIRYDSIQIKIPTNFRLIYENRLDTTYELKSLILPQYQKYYPHLSSALSWVCIQLYFPINQYYLKKSNSVYFDLGLKYPFSGRPIIFKVTKDKYPRFTNWRADNLIFILVQSDKSSYIKLFHNWGGRTIDDYINNSRDWEKIELKKNSH